MSNKTNDIILEHIQDFLEEHQASLQDIDTLKDGRMCIGDDCLHPNLAEFLQTKQCARCTGKGIITHGFEVDNSALEEDQECPECGGKGYRL